MPMTLISRTTLTTSAASVTFNSIPQTFQTLKLVMSVRASSTGNNVVGYQFNTSTSGYSGRSLEGYGTGAGSYTTTTISISGVTYGRFMDAYLTGADQTANTFSSISLDIPNYFGNANKAWSVDSVSENNASTAYQEMIAGLWSNTSATTSITFAVVSASASSFVSGSTFSLYGVS